MLKLNSRDKSPRAVVIYGEEGIGKTTLVNAVVSQLNLENYRYVIVESPEESNNEYSLAIVAQENLEKYSSITFELDEEGRKYNSLPNLLFEKFQCEGNKPLFLFIDDVDLLGVNWGWRDILGEVYCGWLPERSRMVLTTRNLKATDFCEQLGLKRIPHPMDTLPDDQAMEILCKDAANCELINHNDVKRICGGIPLVLKLVGAYLKMMEYKVVKCPQILESLEQQGKQIKDENLSELLIDSVYRQMDDFAQEAFLDICCFFNKWHRQQVEYIVGAEAVGSLIDAGLVNTSVITDRQMFYGGLVMGEELLTVHDVVRAKGRSMSKFTRIRIRYRDWKGRHAATRDQVRTAKAIRVRIDEFTGVEERELNMMKDSLRFLVLKYKACIQI